MSEAIMAAMAEALKRERVKSASLERSLRYIAEREIEPVDENAVPAAQWHKHVRYRHLHEFARREVAKL